MRLHLLGVFNTIPSDEFSHCAFTGRVKRFGKMMIPFGYEVIEYSNEGSESKASEHVVILKTDQFNKLLEDYKRNNSPTDLINIDSKIYREYCSILNKELEKRVRPGDIVCHPLGIAHGYLQKMLPEAFHIEIGVGYENAILPFRIYESYTWMHWHMGRDNTWANYYNWVCPVAQDINDWVPNYSHGDYILYMGRLVQGKGLDVIREIAKYQEKTIILCGIGDPTPWLSDEIPNLIYKSPVSGKERSDLLRNAYCTLMPTVYCEPLGCSAVESMLCGTPVISSDHGAFHEIIKHGITGFRCKTLGDWLKAIYRVPTITRGVVSKYAREKYSLENCGIQLDKIFNQLVTLKGEGWYTKRGTDAIWKN